MRRFVFLVSRTGDEVLDGAAVEVKGETAEDAVSKTASWAIVREGAVLSLIGERVGLGSGKFGVRFVASVQVAELPGYIRQNEHVIAAADEVAA